MALSAILATFWKNSKKVKKTKKILWHWVLLCPLVGRKNDKPEITQTLHKVASEEGLSSMKLIGFQSQMTKWMPFSTHSLWSTAHIWPVVASWYRKTMSPSWVCKLSFEMSFFIIKVQKMTFCEATIGNMVQNGTHSFFTQNSPYLMHSHQILRIFYIPT